MIATAYIKDETEFDNLLADESVLVVDCTATWCGPCKVISPSIDQLANEYSDRAKVLKLDIDANKSIAKRFKIKSIPAVLFFKQGELVENLVGVKSYETFSQTLERFL